MIQSTPIQLHGSLVRIRRTEHFISEFKCLLDEFTEGLFGCFDFGSDRSKDGSTMDLQDPSFFEMSMPPVQFWRDGCSYELTYPK